MGNCPSDLACGADEKKVCFKNSSGEKAGVCFPVDNQKAIDSIKNKEYLEECPTCETCPTCPEQGIQFHGVDFGTLEDDPKLKDFVTFIQSGRLQYFCRTMTEDFIAENTLEMLTLGGVINIENISFDEYITALEDTEPTNTVQEVTRNKLIEYMTNHKEELFTGDDELLEVEKFQQIYQTLVDKACESSTTTTESYTGMFSKQPIINFIIIILIIFAIHFGIKRIQKNGKLF